MANRLTEFDSTVDEPTNTSVVAVHGFCQSVKLIRVDDEIVGFPPICVWHVTWEDVLFPDAHASIDAVVR